MEAYPLHWPVGEPRVHARIKGAFKTALGAARGDLLHELDLLGAKDVVISSNLPLRNDGFPRADATAKDPGIAVYWVKDKVPMVMACDRYSSPAANLRAIGLMAGRSAPSSGTARDKCATARSGALLRYPQMRAPSRSARAPSVTTGGTCWGSIFIASAHPTESCAPTSRPRIARSRASATPTRADRKKRWQS